MKVLAYLRKYSEKIIFALIIGGVITVISKLVIAPPNDERFGFKGNLPPDTDNTFFQRIELVEGQKTLWDWMNLVLVPVTVATLGFWFQTIQERNKDEREQLAKEQAQAEKTRAEERVEKEQREAAVVAYLSSMSDLMVGQGLSALAKKQVKGLLTEEEQFLLDAGVDVIRARTLSILRRLTDQDPTLTDGKRKASVLLFLHESELIQRKVQVKTDEQEDSSAGKSLLDLKGADLTDTPLSNTNLSYANLIDVDLSRAVLSSANLSGSDLTDANLNHVDLGGAQLINANLRNARLSYAHLNRADLSGADLIGAHLNKADLQGADLISAHLNGAHLTNTELSHAHLSGADLSGAHLNDACLTSADLSDANLSRANLSGANLSGARLSGADLSGANLSRVNLSGAHLSSANLSNANLSNANLSRADLSRTRLNRANLSGANLSHAHLSHADLSDAYFNGVNLIGARLRNTNLNRAILFGVDLSRAEELTQQQLLKEDRENSPLLCHVDLPPGISVSRDRDCNRLPEVLHKRYPERFKTIQDAVEFVKKTKNKWN